MVDRRRNVRVAAAGGQSGGAIGREETTGARRGGQSLMQPETGKAAPRPLAAAGNLQLGYPENQKGLGSVILSPDSAELIAGVRVQPFPIYPDDRGYFLEVQRIGRGLI